MFDNATCTGTSIGSAVTANGGTPATDGYYQFTGLSAGDYCVAFSNVPAGYEISPVGQGGDTALDSDADPGTGLVENITLTATDQTIDMGISLDGSIAGLTWCESSTNANTSYDAGDGDTLLSGIAVTLYNDANCNDAIDAPADGVIGGPLDTNASGAYLFDDLPVGPVGAEICYITEVDVNDADLGACDNVITDDTSGSELDTDNPDSTGNDFGFDENDGTLLELGNYVWYDNNQDGLQDVLELGVNGITVTLYDDATCSGTVLDTQVTANGGVPANDGYYLFTGLDAGNYCIEFSGLPGGFIFTTQNSGNDAIDSDVNAANGQVSGINLTGNDYSVDGGMYAAIGTVSGLLFCDTSPENGTNDMGEGVEGVTATLERDLNCDDIGDELIGSIDTDSDGVFEFTGLPVALTPTPPNPAVCYVLTYDENDPALDDCSIPITPETQTTELTVDDPDSDTTVFGVVPRGVPTAVPLSRTSMLLLMVLMIISLAIMRRRKLI